MGNPNIKFVIKQQALIWIQPSLKLKVALNSLKMLRIGFIGMSLSQKNSKVYMNKDTKQLFSQTKKEFQQAPLRHKILKRKYKQLQKMQVLRCKLSLQQKMINLESQEQRCGIYFYKIMILRLILKNLFTVEMPQVEKMERRKISQILTCNNLFYIENLA